MSVNTPIIKWISLVIAGTMLLAACAPAAPAAAPAAAPTQLVEVTRIVAGTPQVEQVVVTATPPPAQPVEITYYTFSAVPDHPKDLDQMVQLFEQSHPNIKIKVVTTPFAEYFAKLQTMVSGGTAPDVFELNFENFTPYAEKGLLLDLSSQLKADDLKIYYPRALQAFNAHNMQLGLPASFSTVVLFYNKDLFDKAGVAYPTKDWTWQDVVDAAKKMTDPKAGVWGLYSPIQFYEFYKRAAQNNCNFFNADKTQVLINSPECVQALQTMVDFVNKDKVVPTDAQMGGVANEDLFKQGKLAMDVIGIWEFAAFKDAPFKWDIQVEPGQATKATHFFANGISVFAASKHPAEAAEWVKFYTSSPDVAKIRIATGWELPALNNPDYFKDYLGQKPPESRQVVFDSLQYAVAPPVIVRQSEMQDAVGKALDQVKLGQLTPQQGLEQAKKAIEALLK